MILWTRTRQFLRTCRIVCHNPIFVVQNLKTSVKRTLLNQAHFLLEIIVCTHGMQSWKPCSKFQQEPNCFCSNSEHKYKTSRYLKISSLSGETLWTRKLHVWQPCRKKTWPQIWKVFRSEKIKKICINWGIFSSEISCGHVKCHF